MCGIFLAIHKSKSKIQENASLYHRALGELSFRGPDLKIEKIFNDTVFFGQTILSLTGSVEKSKGEHLYSKSKRFLVGFNGEIYNYNKLSKTYLTEMNLISDSITDTEVLVNLHDQLPFDEIPKLLDGMYAYAVFDLKLNKLMINRDPQGEKSIYIYEDNDLIIISSEIKAILKIKPAKIEHQVLKDYFSTRHFLQGERTLYKNIRQLKPGHLETINLENFSWSTSNIESLEQFISPETYEQNCRRSLEDLTDELDSIFFQTIKEMIPSNRKYASVVSGGIDSSLISSYAVKLQCPELLIAVNHLGKDLISNDLLLFKENLKQKIKVLNVDKVVYAQSLKNCQTALCAPIFSHSFIGQSLQSQYARGIGCISMFGGEGADELFGGYACYLNQKSNNTSSKFSPSPYTNFTPYLGFEDYDYTQISNELSNLWDKSQLLFSHVECPHERNSHAMMFGDLSYQLPNVGLRGADQMSMMWSLETRSVFIRKNLLKFGLNLPMKYKADRNEKNPVMQTKKILKNLFVRHFGEDLILPKQGFSGFPNESGIFLGNFEHFISNKTLGFNKENQDFSKFSREMQWKTINIEYFLRSRME